MEIKTFLKNIVKYCVPSLFSAVVGLAVIPLISRIYSTTDYGKINLFYSIGNMLHYIVLLGLDSAYIRFYFEQPNGISRKQIFSFAFWSSICITLLITIISVLFFPEFISNYLYGEKNTALLIVMMIYVIGLILFRLLSIENRMEERALKYNIQQILLIFTNRISFVIIAFFSTDYKNAILMIAGSSIALGLFYLFTQKDIHELSIPPISGKVYQDIIAFAIPLMPSTVMLWMNNSAGKFVLSFYKNFEAIGILSIATSVSNIFSLVPSAFSIYWAPFVYKNYKNQNKFICNVHDYVCFLSIILVVGIFGFQEVLYQIVGPEYRSSQNYFMLIMLTPVQALICETTSYGIILSNNTKFNLIISCAAVCFNFFASILLYPFFGIYGVVIGIAGSAIIQLLIRTIIGQRYYKTINKPIKTIISFLTIIIICTTNLFIGNKTGARLIICLFGLIISAILYKKEILDIFNYVSSAIRGMISKNIKNGND